MAYLKSRADIDLIDDKASFWSGDFQMNEISELTSTRGSKYFLSDKKYK